MNNTDLLVTLIGLGFIIIVGIIVIATSIKKSGDKKEATEFLEGLSKELQGLILNTIRNFSIDDIINLDEESVVKIENTILKDIYNITWEYVKNVVEKKSETEVDFFTQAVLALLDNKEFVEEFIRKLIDSKAINQVIHSRAVGLLNSSAEQRLIDSEEEDKQLQEEFSDEEKYIEEVKDEDQTHGEDVDAPTEEEIAELNPQIDEPEELDPENDPSVEIIDENEDIYYDKSGRARSKKTGKWVKANK